MEELYAIVAQFAASHGMLMVFLGAFLSGELAILTSFVLAGQGVIAFDVAFVFSMLGILLADVFWYATARMFAVPQKIQRLFKHSLGSIEPILDQIIHKRLLSALVFVKVLIGFRLAAIVYVAKKMIPFIHFFVSDVIGTFFFTSILALAGYTTGKGILNLLPAFKTASTVLSVVVLLILMFLVSRKIVAYYRKEEGGL